MVRLRKLCLFLSCVLASHHSPGASGDGHVSGISMLDRPLFWNFPRILRNMLYICACCSVLCTAVNIFALSLLSSLRSMDRRSICSRARVSLLCARQARMSFLACVIAAIVSWRFVGNYVCIFDSSIVVCSRFVRSMLFLNDDCSFWRIRRQMRSRLTFKRPPFGLGFAAFLFAVVTAFANDVVEFFNKGVVTFVGIHECLKAF
jgi:hypothetical protein